MHFCHSYRKIRGTAFLLCVSLDDYFKVFLIITVLFLLSLLCLSHHIDDSRRNAEPHNLSHAFVAVVVVVIVIIVVATAVQFGSGCSPAACTSMKKKRRKTEKTSDMQEAATFLVCNHYHKTLSRPYRKKKSFRYQSYLYSQQE